MPTSSFENKESLMNRAIDNRLAMATAHQNARGRLARLPRRYFSGTVSAVHVRGGSLNATSSTAIMAAAGITATRTPGENRVD
jgi:hypothetical protein